MLNCPPTPFEHGAFQVAKRGAIEFSKIESILPGRCPSDISRYSEDSKSDNRMLFLDKSRDIVRKRPKTFKRVPVTAPLDRAHDYRHVFSLDGLSGAVTSLAIAEDHHGRVFCMAGACTSSDSTYNREGELSLASYDNTRGFFESRRINGHVTMDPNGNGNVIYSKKISYI